MNQPQRPVRSLLADVVPREERTLAIVNQPYFSPDNVVVTAVYPDSREPHSGEKIHWPVEVKRSDLLAALDARPNPNTPKEVPEMIKITSAVVHENDALVVINTDVDGQEVPVGPFDRRELLTALNAEPDATDYQEVLAENRSLGNRLSAAVSVGIKLRRSLGLSDTADPSLMLKRIEELKTAEEPETDASGPEAAPYSPRDDQEQIDRGWALEKAGEVLRQLAAVGAVPKDFGDFSGAALLRLAEWIISGEFDRG